MSTYVCPACGHSLEGQIATFEVRQRIAIHRKEHEHQERRRKSWRESAARRYARKTRPDWIGSLHNVGCPGHHGTRKVRGCAPIPCYDHPVAP